MKKAFDDLITAMLPEIETQLRELMRPVFMAGVTVGHEQNRAAIAEAMKALAAATSPEPTTTALAAPGPVITAAPARKRLVYLVPRKNGGYSGVTEAVRKALNSIGRVPAGIDAERIEKYTREKLGKDFTVQQIRSSLKLLCENDEAERFERGYYKAGPKLTVANGSGFVPVIPKQMPLVGVQ